VTIIDSPNQDALQRAMKLAFSVGDIIESETLIGLKTDEVFNFIGEKS
jgi:hypothetical protein